MKKQQIKRIIVSPKNYDTDYLQEDNGIMLDTLKNAWDNLPSDMTLDEREVFFEIAQRLVKVHQRLKKLQLPEEDMEKN